MLKSKRIMAGGIVTSMLLGAMPNQATANGTANTPGAATPAAAAELVEYRLAAWKTTHASGEQADKLVSTLKKLRCEVKVGSHGGHTDVTYRCEKWQSLALKDHKTAHQWESWLNRYGFETKHTH
jgi:hypothetical protein